MRTGRLAPTSPDMYARREATFCGKRRTEASSIEFTGRREAGQFERRGDFNCSLVSSRFLLLLAGAESRVVCAVGGLRAVATSAILNPAVAGY